MILADTSIWIAHLRKPDPDLKRLLATGRICVHPFVVGELACGSIAPRAELLRHLQEMPAVARATDDEALMLIERRRLMARGIGYVDVHLLAAALLTPGTRLWTLDRRLAAVAAELDVSFAA